MQAVILAAGESSRFKPLSENRHKALVEVLGKPVIQHTIEALRDAAVDEIIVVQGPERQIEDENKVEADEYVMQEEPKGMGDALRQAEGEVEGEFLVLTPYRANASKFYSKMIEEAEENGAPVLVSTPTDSPEKFGVFDLDEDGNAVDIVEKPGPEEAPSERKVVGMYLLDEAFFQYLEETEEWEYQFEDALSLQMGEESASVIDIEEETNSLKYSWDLFSVVEELLDKEERSISKDATIADSAEIKGKVIVEEGARIFENAVIRGPAYIGKDVVVGNNSLVRNYSALEEGSLVGANAEVRKSIFQPESSMHSGFVGDSIIGRNTAIGAGTVVANRKFRDGENNRKEIGSRPVAKDEEEETGETSLGTIIGDNADIGVNVSIMPGVQITGGEKIMPGEVVTENRE